MASSVVITGASSGIGAELALRFARRGCNVGLIGRNAERLGRVASQCTALGAGVVETARIDVRQREDLMRWIRDFDQRYPIDLLIANAGVTGGTRADGSPEDCDESYSLIQINAVGLINSVHAVLPNMLARGQGQIGIMSSLAAYAVLADAPSYCASKAMVLAYGQSMQEKLQGTGVCVSVICPGYVDTPMSRRLSGPQAGRLSAADAARIIVAGLDRQKPMIAFPRLLTLTTRLSAWLPRSLSRRMAHRFRVGAPQDE